MGWIKDGEQEKIPDNCPKALADIIQACWAAPFDRPTAVEVVKRLLKAAQANTLINKLEKVERIQAEILKIGIQTNVHTSMLHSAQMDEPLSASVPEIPSTNAPVTDFFAQKDKTPAKKPSAGNDFKFTT